MLEDDEIQAVRDQKECEEFVQWAVGKTKQEIDLRIEKLLATNSYARDVFSSAKYGSGIEYGRGDRPILTNHTRYQRPGSENWEHDDTGSEMNYSGCADDMLNARAENEGWEAGYDFDAPPEDDGVSDVSI